MSTRFGRYNLLRPLGKGGMAEVFLARYLGPQGFEKELVIKRVLPRLADDRQLLRLFFEEAKTQVSFSHGNLVSVSDFGRVGNDYFIAMEHVRGADLASLLAAERAVGGTLSPALVAYLGIELCRGLAYVHRRGFVHRDLSPRNVLLSIDGEVKLSDFGLALAVAMESSTVSGLRGTVAYMPPEQARGERVDARSNLYSLGMLLAEAVLGHSLRLHTAGKDPVMISEATDAVPDGTPLGRVLARALRASPAHRFGWAGEMSAALEEELRALGVGRESLVRELAAKVEPLARRADVAEGAPRVANFASLVETGPQSGESYYRDQRSASFIEDVLAAAGGAAVAPPAPRKRRWWWLAAGVALLAGTTTIVMARRQPDQPKTAASATPPPAPVAASPPPAAVPAPAPPAAPSGPEPAASKAPAPVVPAAAAARPAARNSVAARSPAAGAAGAAALGTGTLVIYCTPWCVPYVDDRPAGQDGRSFSLKDVAAGAHRIEARRLDDRQRQQIIVQPAQQSTVTFTFD